VAALTAGQQAQQAVADQSQALDTAVAALVREATQPAPSTPTTTDRSNSGSKSTASTAPSSGNSTDTDNDDSADAAGSSAGRSTSGGSSATGTGGASGTDQGNADSGGQPGGAVTVASAEAALSKARIALTTAETALKRATLTAPISGTVSAVPFAEGDDAGTQDAVVIVGKGAVQIDVTVPEATFRTLKTGLTAVLTSPGGGKATGRIAELGLLPDDSSSGTTTYPVTVTADGADARTLPAGATAAAMVNLATSTDVLLVPVSAVVRDGDTGTIQVLNGSVATRTRVDLGTVGATTVEVAQGLEAGQTVVLADNDTALPTTTSSNQRRTGSGLGAGTGGPPVGGGVPGGGAAPGGR